MDYDLLLEGCCEVGRRLLEHGAEIQRAEDTARRILAAYGLEGDVFAIPNCVGVRVLSRRAHPHGDAPRPRLLRGHRGHRAV